MSFSADKLRTLLNPNTATAPQSSSALTSASASANSSGLPPPTSSLLDTLLRTYELPVDSSALEQIELCVDASLHCLQAGSRRKAAFFLIQAAGLYQELHQYAACTTLLQAIGHVYKIELAGTARAGDASAAGGKWMSAARRYERGESNEPWAALQRSILEHIIYAAHKSNSQPQHAAAATTAITPDQCILQLLAALHDQLDTQYQASLAASLRSLSSSLPIDTRVDCMGLPILRLLSPVPLPASQQPHRESESTNSTDEAGTAALRLERISTQDASDVFLFSPDTDSDSRHRPLASLHHCAGETLQVEALLANPLRISLHVQSIQLLTEGLPFVAHSTHITLQPEEIGRRVVLTGRPEGEGKLKLVGCAIRCFNLTSEHLVDRAGVGLPPAHVAPVDEDDLDRSYPASDVHEIHIEPPMPLLECRVLLGQADGDRLSFLVGERGELVLRLTNRGSLPIEDVNVRILPMFVQNSEQKQITYYSEEELKAEQETDAAKSLPPTLSPPLPSASLSTPRRPPAAPRSPSFTPLPASSSFSSAAAAKRVFDFARSVTLSRRHSTSDSAPTSPVAAAPAPHPASLHLPPSHLTTSTDNVAAALPLLPGQHVDIAVRVNAVDECCGLEYTVCYAADKLDRSYRLVQDNVRWDVLPALACKHVAVLPALQRPSATSAAAPSLPLHLLLDVANKADVDLVLHVDVDLSSRDRSDKAAAHNNATRIRRQSNRRLLLPLSYMSFGERADRQLLNLSASTLRSAAGEERSQAALLHHCLQVLHQRVRLSWESDESASSGARRRGQLMPALSVSLTQLAQLLAPPVVFSCECENKQSEMTDSQHNDASQTITSPPPYHGPSPQTALPALPSPSSFSSTPSPPFLPPTSLVRNVSTVLMADKLVRTQSTSSSPAALSPSSGAASGAGGGEAPVLFGFGPHRVPVGSFVRVSIDVRNNSGVLGTLGLQLRISHADGSDSAQQQHHQQPVVLTAGSLSPLLPAIAAGDSVRHEWSVCCLAKGNFAFRLSANTQPITVSNAVSGGQDNAAVFARLHASLSRVQAADMQPAVNQQPLTVRAPSEVRTVTAQSAINHFACPQLLLFDAYV